MAGPAPLFQRLGPAASSVSILTTITVAGISTFQLSGYSICEIVNQDTSKSAAFLFTPAGAASGTAATTNDRVIPPQGVLYERLPQGASWVSAIAISGTPNLTFTPGQGGNT